MRVPDRSYLRLATGSLLAEALARPEDNRSVVVDEHAVSEVPVHRAREHGPLDVPSDHAEHLGIGLMRDAADILLDDRSLVEVLGGVVRRGADQFHAAVVRPGVWRGPGEGRQERVVDVDHRGADAGQEVTLEDLHVAGEGDEVEVADEQIELTLLGLGLGVWRHRDMVIRHAERGHLRFEVGVVGHHGHDVHVQLVAAPAPGQVEQTVLVAGDEDCDPLSPRRGLEPPAHVEVNAAKDLVSDYRYECAAQNLEPVPIVFTFSVCGSMKTLEFLQWLGVDVPRWIANDLRHADDTLDASYDQAVATAIELIAFCRRVGVPFGLNVESVSIRRVEIEASVRLAARLTAELRR